MRLQTESWKVDHDTLGFAVYRLPKSSLQFQGDMGMGRRARGVARRAPTGQVEVAVEVKMPLFSLIFYWLLVGVLWALMTYTFCAPLVRQNQLSLAIIVSGGLLFLLIVVSVLYMDWENRYLLRVVKEALGGAEFEDREKLKVES